MGDTSASKARKRANHDAVRPEPTPAGRDAPMYVGTIAFYVDVKFAKKKTHWKKKIDLDWQSDHMPTPDEIEQEFRDEKDRIEDWGYEIDYIKRTDDPPVVDVHKVDPTPTDITKRRAQDRAAPAISGYWYNRGVPANSWRPKGRCVFDFLRAYHGNTPRCKTVCAKDEYIALAMQGALGAYGSPGYVGPSATKFDAMLAASEDLRVGAEYYFKWGANSEEIGNYCRYVNCHLVQLDECEQIVQDVPANSTGKHIPPVVYRINNHHFYPVTDPAMLRSIVRRTPCSVSVIMSGQGKTPEPSEAPAKKSKFETEKVYVEDVDDTRGFLVDLIKNGGHLPPKHGGITAVDQEVHPWSIRLCEAGDGGGTEVRSVTYCLDPSDATKLTKYVLNSPAGVAKLIAGRMGVLAEDPVDCLGNVAQALQEKHCRGLIKSTPNPLLDQWFHARNREPHGLLSHEKTAAAILKDLQRNKAIFADLNAAHSISMYLPEDDFMSFSHK